MRTEGRVWKKRRVLTTPTLSPDRSVPCSILITRYSELVTDPGSCPFMGETIRQAGTKLLPIGV